MWIQAALMIGGAVLDEYNNKQQEKDNKQAAQEQINANTEAANKNIKLLEREAQKSASNEQQVIINNRIAAAEAQSAAQISQGTQGQSANLYVDKALRTAERETGQRAFQFESLIQDIYSKADQISYNTNLQNQQIARGASTTSTQNFLNTISSGLNIASAYYQGTSRDTSLEIQQQQIDSRYNVSNTNQNDGIFSSLIQQNNLQI